MAVALLAAVPYAPSCMKRLRSLLECLYFTYVKFLAVTPRSGANPDDP